MRHLLMLALSLSLASAACSKKKGVAPPDPRFATDGRTQPTGTRAAPGTAVVTATGDGAESAPDTSAIFFAFDSVTLSSDARDALDRLAAWMSGRANRLTIEGHADEQGTTEYNVALGQRRAEVIADYLARLGVARTRLDTISYGEERPSDDGHDEAAYARNRRGELHPR
jgi:peptidoglycan-associated lipoprotein